MSMRAKATKSKVPRNYDATGRRERARQQRDGTLDQAERLFLDRGYAATTVESIAQAAGVSASTVYKTYGGKAGLARELCARALLGTGTVPAEARSDELRAGDDPRAIVAGWGALAAEVSPRVSPLALLLRAAADADGDAAALYAELSDTRLDRMAANARHLAHAGHLRPGVTAQEGRDVLWFCTSAELYDLMVVQRGWAPERFGELVADLIAGALL